MTAREGREEVVWRVIRVEAISTIVVPVSGGELASPVNVDAFQAELFIGLVDAPSTASRVLNSLCAFAALLSPDTLESTKAH